MAGKNIKGINLEIGGSTTKFNKALKDMSSVTKTTQKELDAVNKSLKFDPKNVDLLKQKEELLAKQIEDVRVKVDKMKAAKAKADKEMANGTEINQEQYRLLVREISAAEGHLESLEKQNKETQKSIKKTSEGFANIKKGALAVAGSVIGIGSAAVGAMSAAAEETREYREDMNKLETAFSTTRKSADAARKVYTEIFSVLGESDQAVEASQQIALLAQSEEDAAKWAEIAAGVIGRFGDALQPETFYESANETLKLGEATGAYTQMLEGTGYSVEKFNKGLAKCKTEEEKQAYMLEITTSILGEASTTYKDLNADIIANRKATSEANDQMAKLGASSEGFNAKLKEAKNTITAAVLPTIGKLADKVSDLSEGQIMLIGGIGAIGAAVPTVIIGAGTMVTAVESISKAYKKMAVSATAASVATKAIPFIGVAVGATLLIGAVAALASSTNEETKKAKELHKANMQRYEDYTKIKQSAQEQAEASLSEMSHIGKLKDELMLLADENGRVADSDKARAEFILGQLNGALGTEYTMTGNLISKYGELTASIDTLITKKKAEIILSSKEEVYKTAIKNIESQKNALDKSQSAYQDAKKAFEEYEKGIHNGSIAITRDTALQLDAFRRDFEAKKETFQESKKVYNESIADIRDYETTAAEIIKDGGKKIVEEFDKNAGLATEKGVKTAENFNKGIKGVDVKTPAKAVGQFAITGLEEGTERDSLGNTPISLGANVVEGLIKGFDSKVGLLESRAQKMGQTVITALKSKKGLDVNSPAKPAIPIGEAIPQGIAVGIEKDMSAEEALEKKCNNLKKILSDFTADFKAGIELAESEYDLWVSENLNASDADKESKQRELLQKKIVEHQQNVNNINEALKHQEQLTGIDSIEYKQLLAQLNNAKTDLNKANAELTELNKYKPPKLTSQFSQANYDLAESNYILWIAQNPEAVATEKLAAEEKKLTTQYEEQGKKVQDLNEELYITNQLYGENSEESKKLLVQLNEEKTAYANLAAEIARVNEEKAKAASKAYNDYNAYKRTYSAGLKASGYSETDVDAVARKVSGYTGERNINVNNYISGTTPDTAYKVGKETAKQMNNFAMQGVL